MEARELVEVGGLLGIEELNYSVEKKRILDEKWEPDFSDNVKQDISIDVYGRDQDDQGDQGAIKDLYNA